MDGYRKSGHSLLSERGRDRPQSVIAKSGRETGVILGFFFFFGLVGDKSFNVSGMYDITGRQKCHSRVSETAPHSYSPYRFSFRYGPYVVITTTVCQSLTVTAAYRNIDCFRRYNPLRAWQSVS